MERHREIVRCDADPSRGRLIFAAGVAAISSNHTRGLPPGRGPGANMATRLPESPSTHQTSHSFRLYLPFASSLASSRLWLRRHHIGLDPIGIGRPGKLGFVDLSVETVFPQSGSLRGRPRGRYKDRCCRSRAGKFVQLFTRNFDIPKAT
jgi:hypothetical protein